MLKTFSATKNFKYCAILSVLLVAAGLVALLAAPFGVNLFNLDIDFAGGTSFTYQLNEEVTPDVIDKVEDSVADVAGKTVSAVPTGNGTQVLIKTKNLSSEDREKLHEAMKTTFSLEDDARQDVQNVSPAVGKDMQAAAVKSSLVAALLMLLYITIRFDYKSGFAAVICLIHDVLVMISAYVIFQLPVNMNFIAAALTIFGYSINASIITFDRIRENQKLSRRESYDAIVDKSVRQSFTRNINTTLTTLFTIVLIIFTGVSSLVNFAIPITVGIVSGAYSSIFVAAPLWALLKKHQKKAK